MHWEENQSQCHLASPCKVWPFANRFIKCDQKVPYCGNCRRSQRICTGYKRRLGYVFSNSIKLSELESSCEEGSTITHEGRWKGARQQPLSFPKSSSPGVNVPPLDCEDNLPPACYVSNHTALRQQFHYLFCTFYLPAEMMVGHYPRPTVSANLLVHLLGAEINSDALDSCLYAFFAAKVGRRYKDENLLRQSRSMYVAAMANVRKALTHPHTRLSEDTLAACMALSLYELTERPPGKCSAYTTHQRGAMTLLQLRGPDANTSPLAHSVFLGLRSQAVRVQPCLP